MCVWRGARGGCTHVFRAFASRARHRNCRVSAQIPATHTPHYESAALCKSARRWRMCARPKPLFTGVRVEHAAAGAMAADPRGRGPPRRSATGGAPSSSPSLAKHRLAVCAGVGGPWGFTHCPMQLNKEGRALGINIIIPGAPTRSMPNNEESGRSRTPGWHRQECPFSLAARLEA